MNHAGIVVGCASCHNGAAAEGKPATHIPTSAPCESCHKSTVTFSGARMDHSRVTAPCASCHNGITAEGKTAKHFVTTLPCESCHRPAAWILVTYRHASPRYPDHGKTFDCVSCHSANAQTVQWKFAAYQPDCAACHANVFRPIAHLKFQKPVPVYYTVAELRDCTGACHIYADSTLRTILTRRQGEHRANRGGW
jgi:hypothetical protein